MPNEILAKGLKQGRALITEIKGASLRFNQIKIQGNGNPVLYISDPAYTEGNEIRSGIQYFATLPEKTALHMPGSVIDAKMFLTELGYNEGNLFGSDSALMGDEIGKVDSPIFHHQEDGFEINAFHGSRCLHAVNISRIANDPRNLPNFDFKDEQLRADYQQQIDQVVTPVLSHDYYDFHNIRIVEDCIATGDTIIGTLATLMNNRKLKEGEIVRVDVNVATTQGILLLRQFAKQNGINLRINTGYLAYGLTTGQLVDGGKVPQHANYLMYPPMEEFADLQNKQVVADMGSGVQSLPDSYDQTLLHNKFRGIGTDNHGAHSAQGGMLESEHYNSEKPMLFVFANGGYGMHAYHQLVREHMEIGDPKRDYNVFVLRASRVWSDDEKFGYGVALKNMNQLLLN